MPKIDELLLGMIEERGSDLHVASGHPPRIRVDGELVQLDMPAFDELTVTAMMREICPPERWHAFQENNDLDFAYQLDQKARFRCNYLVTMDGVAAVLRIIPSDILTVDQLDLPSAIRELCYSSRGLIIVTGPTGSGKSTTLAALIDHINRKLRRRIITVEDPIEFVHSPRRSTIIHREVGDHCMSFSQALKSAMRGDPDVLLLGEMRDAETIRLALNCAAMGTLVFATLHTNSAPKTIDRIIDAFPADEQQQVRVMLSETLTAVIAQQLCKRADQRGRIAAHEILLRTQALPNAIRDGNTKAIRTIIEGGRKHGMVSLDAMLYKLMSDGTISPLEAYMKAVDKEQFTAFKRRYETSLASDDEETVEMIELNDLRYTTALSPINPDEDDPAQD